MPQPSRHITARIAFRKGTTDEWLAGNPVLLDGEPAWNTANGLLKIGDGETAWADLPYIQNLGGGFDHDGTYFPLWINTVEQAVEYVMDHVDHIIDDGFGYFSDGLNDTPFIHMNELSVGGGTGGIASIVGAPREWNNYDEGEEITIEATPIGNFTFVEWTGETNIATSAIADRNSARTTLTMPSQSIRVTASFTTS